MPRQARKGRNLASYNRTVLMGNLTRDVDLQHSGAGNPYANAGLAVNNRVKKDGEWTEEPCFIDLMMFGRTAEIAAEYLSKGSPVLVEGEIHQDRWEDKETGAPRTKHKVVCNTLKLLPKGNGSGGGGGGGGSAPSMPSDGGDDVPF